MLEYNALQNYLVFDNEHANLVTALPYIDEKLDENSAFKDQVSDMIKQEMLSMMKNPATSTRDYLEKLPLPTFTHLVRIKPSYIILFRSRSLFRRSLRE